MLTEAGVQVPEMPFIELDGRAGTALPWQMVIALPKLNDGVTFGLTVTVNVMLVEHCPASGVKV